MSKTELDVVGAKEAAGILGVELQRISRWRKLGRLPAPYADLALSPVWIRSEIEALAADATFNTFTPPPDPPPLLGTAEVAAFLDVDKSQVARWRNGKTAKVVFPEPDTVIAAGPLWSRQTVEKFAVIRQRPLLLTASQMERINGQGMEPAGRVKTGLLYRPVNA